MRSLLLGSAVAGHGWLTTTVAALAQAEPSAEPPFVAESGDPGITILPRPDSGRAPQSPGDPGGWMQLVLLAGLVLALVVIAALVWRDVRRKRRA